MPLNKHLEQLVLGSLTETLISHKATERANMPTRKFNVSLSDVELDSN